MPNCHGAGGLAGQHRFGARHGTSVVVLGTFKMLLAVFFGASALTLLDALPVAVLGVMLVIAGLELAGTGVGVLIECVEKEKDRLKEGILELKQNEDEVCVRDQHCNHVIDVEIDSKAILQKNALVTMVTTGVIVALQKTHYGAIAGWMTHMIYGNGFSDLIDWMRKKRERRSHEAEGKTHGC